MSTPTDTAIGAGTNPAVTRPLSKLEEIKAKRARFLEKLWVDAEIPTWDGLLVARYRPLLQPERDKLTAAKLNLQQANVAMVTRACIGLSFDNEPILDADGMPSRFDQAAVEFLGIEGITADASDHDICRAIFAADKNPAALDAHADGLAGWMMDPRMPAGTPASD